MDTLDRIEALIEESRTNQGEARERIYQTLAKLFDLAFDLNGISLIVDQAFADYQETGKPGSPQESDHEQLGVRADFLSCNG